MLTFARRKLLLATYYALSERRMGKRWVIKGERIRILNVEPTAYNSYPSKVAAHELGHSVGLWHNRDLQLPASPLGKDMDIIDIHSLMWDDTNGGDHIGFAHWMQLNQSN